MLKDHNNQGTGALDGVRVVDLTTVLMGPLATRMLADHGADVIRVERPAPRAGNAGAPQIGELALNIHRNKRSIQLDLKSELGAKAMHDLLGTSDVLVTNMRIAALEKLGLSVDKLHQKYPRLIHCVANGFGSSGPYAGRAAYDDAIQAASGIASLTQGVDGEPAYSPYVVADKVCALHVVQAVLAALLHQRTSGQGQAIEIPMFETMVAFNLIEHLREATLVPPTGPVGYARLLTPFRRPYRCADGWIALLPYSDRNWRDFFVLVGRLELLEDERFVDHDNRINNIDALYRVVSEVAPQRTVTQWLEACDQLSIPASPVNDLEDLLSDRHIDSVGLIEDVVHPDYGTYRYVADPTTYSSMSTGLRHHAPHPGQHTGEIMGSLGWDDEMISQL